MYSLKAAVGGSKKSGLLRTRAGFAWLGLTLHHTSQGKKNVHFQDL